ncbi:hypothetical protein TNCT_460171 [Trichonephila clavata]|uniref:Uncharacterized protein n=1 Tax=Trichonephila clavata TaxID=2740835 RepID=A0A8X6KZ45_TRICU|nr:hypothetical protein TNCT_460171 [Trichonephila clavata]
MPIIKTPTPGREEKRPLAANSPGVVGGWTGKRDFRRMCSGFLPSGWSLRLTTDWFTLLWIFYLVADTLNFFKVLAHVKSPVFCFMPKPEDLPSCVCLLALFY